MPAGGLCLMQRAAQTWAGPGSQERLPAGRGAEPAPPVHVLSWLGEGLPSGGRYDRFHWVIVGLPGGAVERFGGPEEQDRHPWKPAEKTFPLLGHSPRLCQSLYRADLCPQLRVLGRR